MSRYAFAVVILIAFCFAAGGCPCPPKMTAPHARMHAAPGELLAYTVAPGL